MPFRALYFLFIFVAYLLGLPFLCILSFRSKYKYSIPKRFFIPKIPKNTQIWLHGCSFGEIASLEIIILELLKKHPNKNILLTTTTQTGFFLAQKLFLNHKNISISFLPFEIFLCFYTFKSLETLIVTESELWFYLFYSAKKSGAKTLLINARISDRSLRSYMRLKFLHQRIFSHIDIIFSQSKKDTKRLNELGAADIRTFGNLKIFTPIQNNKYYKAQNEPIFIAASTHKGEEEMILKAFLELKNDALLIIAPRHPERFSEVEALIKANKVNYVLHSKIKSENLPKCKILLLDSLGELKNFYAISDLAILGGAFAKIGGHNPLEPANFGNIILTGEHIFNQEALFSQISHFYTVKNSHQIYDKLKNYKALKKAQIINKSQNLEAIINEI